MPTPQELVDQFWMALRSDRTLMLGLEGIASCYPRPMNALLIGEHGPIWFFTSRGNAIVQQLSRCDQAFATFAAKDHDLFATILQ
jgi:general stress protein 26